MSPSLPLELPRDMPPTVIILDGGVRYLRLVKVLQAAGFDCRFEGPLGQVLRISERVTQ